MNHNVLTRTVLCVLLLIVLTVQAVFPVYAAGQKVSLRMDSPTGEQGNIVTVSVYLDVPGGGTAHLAGMTLGLTFDSARLTYVSGSGKSEQASMSELMVNLSATAPKIIFAWLGDTAVSIKSGSKLCSVQFRVLDIASVGQAGLSLAVNSLFTFTVQAGQGVKWEDLDVSSPVAGYVTVSNAADSAVTEVISAINAIGTVTYTDQCLTKINKAAGLYAILNELQRTKVTNYQTLLEAKVEYERLKAAAGSGSVQKEINDFLSAHAAVLALTVDTVAIKHDAAVAAAYAAFGALSTEAKYEIFSYNALLKALSSRISVLKKDEADRLAAEEAERLKREEATQLAAEFRRDQKELLALSVDDVILENYPTLNNAIGILNTICEANPYVGEKLVTERMILEALLKKAEELVAAAAAGEPPSVMAANRFTRSFGWLLALTEGSVAAEDLLDIRTAIEVYNVLDDDVKELLANEYALLEKLLKKSQALADAQKNEPGNPTTDSTDSTGGTPTGDDTQPSTDDTQGSDSPNPTVPARNPQIPGKGEQDVSLSFRTRQIGVITLLLPIAVLASLMIFAALQAYYRLHIKKRV